MMNPNISVVVPTRNSGLFIQETLWRISRELISKNPVEIIVVDDFSNDETLKIVENWLPPVAEHTCTVVQLSKNVGQHLATAIGLTLAKGNIIVTIDDDLAIHEGQINSLLSSLTDSDDFSMAAILNSPNGVIRQFATNTMRVLTSKMLGLPSSTHFSSFVALRHSFLERVVSSKGRIDEPLWTFNFSHNFSQPVIQGKAGLRSKSNYTLKKLVKLSKPILSHHIAKILKLLSIFSFMFASLAAFSILFTTFLKLTGKQMMEGFPTIVVLLMANLSFVLIVLSFTISNFRQINHQKSFNESAYIIAKKTHTGTVPKIQIDPRRELI